MKIKCIETYVNGQRSASCASEAGVTAPKAGASFRPSTPTSARRCCTARSRPSPWAGTRHDVDGLADAVIDETYKFPGS